MLKVALGIFLFIYITVLIISYIMVVDTVDPANAAKLQASEMSGFISKISEQTSLKPAPKKSFRDFKSKQSEFKKKYSPRQKLDMTNANPMRLANPFFLLGAYPEISDKYQEKSYDEYNYNLYNDENYCDKVDMANLKNPDLIFNQKSFWTDFPKNQLPRQNVMVKIGVVPKLKRYDGEYDSDSDDDDEDRGKFLLSEKINSFFVQFSAFHEYHKIGSHFLCASQMYNHIPGVESLVTKDQVVDKINAYIQKYEDKPQCFNKKSLFPYTYRLYVKEECETFFELINSKEYKASLKKEAIQYVIKVGHGSHKSQGVFLLDKQKTEELNDDYDVGDKCGSIGDSLLAQTYITNPLLLNFNNKFDFRVYMLIASTNPLIVYYHDGFIKNSLYEYKKTSGDRGTHITNTYLANLKIDEAKKKGEKIFGMNEQELKKYILWDFEELQTYLLEAGKVTDPSWLDNYLRPALHRAFIHLTRMTKETYWKGSNVYALQGADFMLDDNMNLWFIESNPSPLMSGTTKWKIYLSVVRDHFEVQYAYLKSRMKRALQVIKDMQAEAAKTGQVDYSKWTDEFQDALRNRLEPEFAISPENSWVKIVDENYEGAGAYMDYITPDCL